MSRLVGWHVRLGETGLRLFQLHLLWVVGTLAGGVVLGVFPATAAVVAVLRRDALHGNDEVDEPRPRLRAEFAAAWKAELWPSNRLGAVLAAAWFLLLWDRHLLGLQFAGAVSGAAAGLLWLVTLVAGVATTLVWSLQAHFTEGVAALLRRALVLAVGRPGVALGHVVVVGAVLCLYYLVPGLVPVLGVALPAWASFGWLWRSGVLPAPAASVQPPTTAVPVEPAPVGARTGVL